MDFPQQHTAEQRILEAKERITPIRTRVFAYLLAQDSAVTHLQIESDLGAPKIDRVTLYRVLDWLAEKKLCASLGGR